MVRGKCNSFQSGKKVVVLNVIPLFTRYSFVYIQFTDDSCAEVLIHNTERKNGSINIKNDLLSTATKSTHYGLLAFVLQVLSTHRFSGMLSSKKTLYAPLVVSNYFELHPMYE